MTADLQLAGPTVTLYGERDALDAELSAELGRRGCSTHAVTIPVGWLDSGSHAVVRLDTLTGERALHELASRDAPAAHVVVVCENSVDTETATRLDQLCRQCGDRHHISLIWHTPLETRLDHHGAGSAPATALAPDALALVIADEIGHQDARPPTPSFASQLIDSDRLHPHH